MSPLALDEACTAIQDARGEAIAVVTMSPIAFWTDRHEGDYLLMGLMGGAASIGLGIALGRPDRTVVIIDGDGSLLMQLGVLAAIADAAPPNLVHVVIENSIYAVSGGQPTPGPRDWGGLFEAAGYSTVDRCDSTAAIAEAFARDRSGPHGIVVSCAGHRPNYPPRAFAGINPAAEAARVRLVLTT